MSCVFVEGSGFVLYSVYESYSPIWQTHKDNNCPHSKEQLVILQSGMKLPADIACYRNI